jgi:hypothetical protein
MSEYQDIPELRRNLSLGACQPCRKAKIGCDHEKPGATVGMKVFRPRSATSQRHRVF